MQNHTLPKIVNHSKSTALERSANILLDGCDGGVGMRLERYETQGVKKGAFLVIC